ncbi:AraC family transcriptional regulator [Gordonia sp. OPL2]|nr:AraC family transcriptional regulator [Gordonia sp. OPL2]
MDLIWTGREVLIAGPDTVPYRHRSRGPETMVGLRLPPGTVPVVLGVPADVLRDRRVTLDDIWTPGRARRWGDLLAAADDPAAVLRELASIRTWEAPAWLGAAAAALGAGHRIDECADRLSMTPRTLHRQSSRYFGYGPKTLQRILRMRAALDDLTAGVDPADVAAWHGYADQPHLHREVVALTGRTPASFHPPSNDR